MTQEFDAVIIGSGYAGLSAAALLSKQGRRVLLLERAGRLGGRASYVEKDGFVWEYGQHSCRLAGEGIAARVFNILERPLEFLDTRRHESFLYMNGKLYPRPEGPLALLLTELMSFRARLDFLRFYARLLSLNPSEWYDKTLLELYRMNHGNAEVERFLPFLGLTVMVADPALVSAGEVIQFLKRAAKARVKQGEPKGGTRQLIDKLHDSIFEHGGEVRMSETALSIMTEQRTAVGVRTHQGDYRAGAVVCAFPLFRLFDVIDEALFAPEFVNYARNIKSSGGLSIDFVFDEPVTDIKGSILGVNLPLWVKFQSNVDPESAPRGKHVCTWGLLFPPEEPATQEAADKTEARIKGIMEELYPGILAKVVHERKLFVPVLNGSMLIPRQSYPHRPDVASEDVARLYFIGDTTRGEGCSGDIAFSSAIKLSEKLP